LDIYPEGYIVI